MRGIRIVAMLSAIVFLLVANVAGAAEVNSYWQRMGEGFPNTIAVHEYVYEYKAADLEIKARIPQLVGVGSELWQAEFNQRIRGRLDEFVTRLNEMAVEAHDIEGFSGLPYEGIVDFEVKLNQGGLLSIALVNYAYTGGAHGMTYYDYINIDLTSGHQIAFSDLFNSEAELKRATEIIRMEIKEEPDRFFSDSFSSSEFQEGQGFYLQDTHAVICFGLYELAPYAHGIQEFTIPAP
jgi:hypothetical protein